MASEQILEIDVAVVGSGAAGFAAALTAQSHGLDVQIFEKAEHFGGTTALSGGVAWIPGHALMLNAAQAETEDVYGYIQSHAGNRSTAQVIQAFISQAPQMLRFLTQRDYVRFNRMAGFPDYRAEAPGGNTGADGESRSVEPQVFAGSRLGDLFAKQRYRARNLPVVGTMTELRQLAAIKTDFREALKAWRAIPRSLWGKLTGAKHMASGAALIGWLAHAANRQGIPLHLSTTLCALDYQRGQVVGATFEKDEQTFAVRVRRGVILATGGFDHNADMRRAYLPESAAEHLSAGATSNNGDGHLAAQEVGASLANMDQAWWAPTCMIPGVGPQIVIFERGKPGQIIVDAGGKRFTNEAQPYGDFVRAMLDAQATSGDAIPAYMVFDQNFRDRYPIGHLLPGITPKEAIDSGFLTKAETIQGLAQQLSIDPGSLAGTVERFNKMAVAGRDEDFARGQSAFDRYSGDPTVGPNPCLGTLERAPFYAVKLYPGDLGTSGGVLTNEHAQALTPAGDPIQGLYAAGNCASSVLGGFYPGAGGTIGPAMTFGYIAGNHIART